MSNGLVDWLWRLLSPRRPTASQTSPFPEGRGPVRLMILRHAEKTGQKSDPHLSAAGQDRAERLADYIPQTFGTPDFLIAAASSKRSLRPYETLQPMAEKLGLEIMEDFDDEEIAALVERLRDFPAYSQRFGIISWRHSDIPALAAALGAPDGTYPAEWDSADFSLILDMTFPPAPAAGSVARPQLRKIVPPF